MTEDINVSGVRYPISQHLLNRIAKLSPMTEVAVSARVAAFFGGRGQLNACPVLDFMDHGEALLSDFRIPMGKVCRNSHVSE